jgi:hypothetical protein
MTTHAGCVWDYPEDVALAHTGVRGNKLALCSVLGDDDQIAEILDEIGDCAVCLRLLVQFFAGATGSLSVAVAEAYGGGRMDAVRQFRKLLAD